MMTNQLKKYLILVFLLLFVGSGTARAQPDNLEISFIGNAAFRLSDGTVTLFTDFPYESGAYGYMSYEYNFPSETGDVISLITHRHMDHFEPFVFEEQDWRIIGPKEITVALSRNKIIPFSGKIKYGPLRIRPVKSSHANTEHYSYLVEWAGRKLFFTGDTEELDIFKNLPELDMLFITPWLHRKAELNKALPPAKKIVIHHQVENEIIPDCTDCLIPVQGQVINFE